MSRESTEEETLEEGREEMEIRSPPRVGKAWQQAVQAAENRNQASTDDDSSEYYTKGDPELANTEQTSASNEAGETRILDLTPYGKTMEQAAERLIEQNDKVLMFEKTWCLFSRDAKSFLIQQMGVSVVTVPLDLLPDQGQATLLEQEYMKRRTRHRTVPIIFIKQEFLGGFEEVNALYSTGKLQDDFLDGLTQADRCEMEVRAAKSALKPLFWFPEKVNANQIRITGVLTCVASIISLLAAVVWEKTWGTYMAYGIFADFALRILAGGKLSPLGRIAQVFALLAEEPKIRVGRPKQFAACCGFLFCLCGSLGYLIPFPGHNYVGAGFYAGLALASGMEGFLDFCLGCVFFRLGINLGLIPK